MERRLSPTPPREPEVVEAEGWEFDLIPVTFGSGPRTLSDGWEPVQLVPIEGDAFLLTRRRIG